MGDTSHSVRGQGHGPMMLRIDGTGDLVIHNVDRSRISKLHAKIEAARRLQEGAPPESPLAR